MKQRLLSFFNRTADLAESAEKLDITATYES